MGLSRVLSYDIENAQQVYLGMIGQGPALDALVGVLSRNDFVSPFPRIKIGGWVPSPGRTPDSDKSHIATLLRNLTTYGSIAELFAAVPNIHVACDLSPDGRYMAELRTFAGPGTSLIAAEMVLRFCSAIDDGRLVLGGGDGLRKTQKLFALLVDQVDGDMLILNEDSVILDVNQHAAESRGMKPSQIIGMPCRELDKLASFCLCDEENCPFLKAKETGKQAKHTFTKVLPSGRVRYIEVTCYPVADAFSSPVLFLYIRRDVTEQQDMEQRLQQTEKMAAIGELSTYMAHEIRNPLFSIGGFANALLRNPSLNDLAREKARIIYEESRRLDIILTSILNFARPTAQEMGVFDVQAVARQTMDIMTLGSEERGISSVVEIEPDLPKASGNAENLKQCLINLVKNAIEAMPEGGVLTLKAARSDQFVRIEVSDTGQGIPPDIREQIFSPFFTTKNGGAGLGLAMTRKVIEEMGGKVYLESIPGKGTKVSLLVPVALAVNEEPDDSRPPSPGGRLDDPSA